MWVLDANLVLHNLDNATKVEARASTVGYLTVTYPAIDVDGESMMTSWVACGELDEHAAIGLIYDAIDSDRKAIFIK